MVKQTLNWHVILVQKSSGFIKTNEKQNRFRKHYVTEWKSSCFWCSLLQHYGWNLWYTNTTLAWPLFGLTHYSTITECNHLNDIISDFMVHFIYCFFFQIVYWEERYCSPLEKKLLAKPVFSSYILNHDFVSANKIKTYYDLFLRQKIIWSITLI